MRSKSSLACTDGTIKTHPPRNLRAGFAARRAGGRARLLRKSCPAALTGIAGNSSLFFIPIAIFAEAVYFFLYERL